MENAVKALLIASGVLVGILIISLAVLGHRRISDYYSAKEEAIQFEQLTAFNKQYTPYHRNNVRGSDLLSLINKITDFNKLKDEEEIKISIYIPNNTETQMIYYNYSRNKDTKLILLGTTYTQNTINTILNEANSIEAKYTKSTAIRLAANISNLMGDNRLKEPEELLEELKMNASQYGGLSVIQNEILKYYQYQQFKRAHFNSENLTYTDNGRVKSFNFRFNGTFE